MSVYLSPQFKAFHGMIGIAFDRSSLNANLREVFSISRSLTSQNHTQHCDIKLIDTFFSNFPDDILSEIFDNARDTRSPVKILFLNPFSEQALLRARLLNDSPIRRSNAGLFKILATLKQAFLREPASEALFHAQVNNESFLYSQINELSALSDTTCVFIRFYHALTTAPVYIIDDFAIGGFLMQGSQAADGPHMVFVNDHSQENDVFDNLRRNFDNTWRGSVAIPTSVTDRIRYDVFLSFSSKDKPLVDLLSRYLDSQGISTYFAPKDIKVGDPFKEEIRNALTDSRYFAVVLSENSITSEWVTTEYGAAWVLRKPILPLLNGIKVDNLPTRLQDLQCIDISEYKKIVEKMMPEQFC